jgi:Periplasmic copper-binding protein (NosD)
MKNVTKKALQFGLFLTIGLSVSQQAQARTLSVGPTAAYRTLASASAASRPGDIIAIQPGSYSQCAVIRTSGITIKAASGRVVLNNTACSGKAALVIAGNDVVVDGLRFSGIRVADGNGAGIRFEGRNLTVRNSVFSDSQTGILTSSISRGTLTIQNSRFQSLGNTPSERANSHGVYVNGMDTVVVTGSQFIGTRKGHHLKSRAKSTTVTGSTFDDGATGTASYHIDISNGGNLLVRNNVFVKGPNASNRGAVIMIGAEAQTNPTGSLVVTDNQVRSLLTRGLPAFVANRTNVPVRLSNNRLTGRIVEVSGPSARAPSVPAPSVPAARSLPVDRLDLAPISFDIAAPGSMEALSGLSTTGDSPKARSQAPAARGAVQLQVTDVAEPSTLTVAGAGLLGLGLMFGRRRSTINRQTDTTG